MINIYRKEKTLVECPHCKGTGKCFCSRENGLLKYNRVLHCCVGVCEVCEGRGKITEVNRTVICSVGLLRYIFLQLFGRIGKDD